MQSSILMKVYVHTDIIMKTEYLDDSGRGLFISVNSFHARRGDLEGKSYPDPRHSQPFPLFILGLGTRNASVRYHRSMKDTQCRGVLVALNSVWSPDPLFLRDTRVALSNPPFLNIRLSWLSCEMSPTACWLKSQRISHCSSQCVVAA